MVHFTIKLRDHELCGLGLNAGGVPESGPMHRWNWKANDAICSRIKAVHMPSTMDALKEQILSDIALGP